ICVGRIHVNEFVPGRRVVPAEVQERRATETFRETPPGPRPSRAVVARPGKLRIGGVARPDVERAVHAEQAAGFLADGTVAVRLSSRRAKIPSHEVGWAACDFCETNAELLRDERLKAVAIAVGAVERVVVRPR